MMNPDDDKLIAHARRTLDAAADGLDELTRARLRAARLRALDADARPDRRWWIGLGSAVTAGLVALAVGGVLWLRAPQPPAPLAIAGVDDLELLLRADSPEFFKELEFYLWLSERNDA
jgi:hypothetical protein